MDSRLTELTSFGLSEPQIAAYAYLLKREVATAPEVATGAGIPRNRAYEILDSLAALGLVQVVAGTKRNYKSLPVGSFLARKISDAQGALDRLRERAPAIERELVPAVDSQGFLGAFATWRGRAHVAAAAKRIIHEARASIHISGPPVAVHRWLTPVFGDILEARLAEGVDVRLLVTLCDNPEFDPLLDVPHKAVLAGGSVAKIVVDGRLILIRASDGKADDEAYEMRHEGLAHEAVSVFDHLWACPANVRDAQGILRVPREGSTPVREPDTTNAAILRRPDNGS